MDGFRSCRARSVLAALVVCLLAGAAWTASAGAETLVFTPGPEQSFVVPAGVTHITVTAIGEKGRNICFFGCFSGFSEKVTATLTVTPGERLYADFTGAGAAGGGGFGDGGNAADLRTAPHTEAGSSASRVIVAGGGGGEGEVEEGSFPGQGGNAGGAEGQAGNPSNPQEGAPGGGGTQSKGGAGGAAGGGGAGEAGQLGHGGKGGAGSTQPGDAGGGGGGYYGGGGGGGGNFVGPGGGGGSSFVEAGAEGTSFALNSAEEATSVTVTYAGGTETLPFNASSSEQSFVVPLGVTRIKVVAVGANGEDRCACGQGMGATVTAALAVKHGQRFFIDFGGGGSSNVAAGGNAADLRTISRSEPGSLASRVVVAGGGGGTGINEENSIGGHGGNAGFAEGAAGGNGLTGSGGGGGTQSKGGAGGKGEANGEEGQLGQGGKGGQDTEGDGGGGGGGYYGGGGGAGGLGGSAGGGGGSSFVVAGAEEVSSGLNGSSKEQSKLSIIYKSASPPEGSITSPVDGSRYKKGESVTAAYSCTEGAGGPGLLPGSEGCSGTVAKGAAVDTSTAGAHELTVTATSQDGLTSSKTVTYDVAAPPSVSITTPAEGASYSPGETVDASYSCAEGTGGPGLKPGSEGCSGTVAKGAAIDTSPGAHEFTVLANSQDGLSASKTVKYTVIAAPTVTITTPGEGAHYKQGETVDADYTCSEGTSGPGLKPGSEGCSGPVAKGAAIDTTAGVHEFTVTARSQDGQSTSRTATYTVMAPPSATITTPADGGTYLQGQVLDASYSCSEGAFGPGLKPGAEGCSGTVADGAAIDTATTGDHEFSATANSTDGQSTTDTVHYDVVEPPVFGRCVKVGRSVPGKLTNNSCTKPAGAKNGRYEWMPGPGPKSGFSLAGQPSAPIALETTNRKQLVCSSVSGGGAITGLKTTELVLVLSGCQDGGEECTNTGGAGQLVLPFNGTLAWADRSSNKLEERLVPKGTLSYQCFDLGVPGVSVSLATTGILLPVKTNAPIKRVTDYLTVRKGVQVPSSLEGEPPLHTEETRLENGQEEHVGAGLRATLVQTNEERDEINSAF
jgi:hypothetical protein